MKLSLELWSRNLELSKQFSRFNACNEFNRHTKFRIPCPKCSDCSTRSVSCRRKVQVYSTVTYYQIKNVKIHENLSCCHRWRYDWYRSAIVGQIIMEFQNYTTLEYYDYSIDIIERRSRKKSFWLRVERSLINRRFRDVITLIDAQW